MGWFQPILFFGFGVGFWFNARGKVFLSFDGTFSAPMLSFGLLRLVGHKACKIKIFILFERALTHKFYLIARQDSGVQALSLVIISPS
jgi:hypothetical protein